MKKALFMSIFLCLSTVIILSCSDDDKKSACSIKENDDGTSTISCEDGNEVTVTSGAEDKSCSVTDNGDGTSTITCDDGTTVTVGGDKTCSVADNGDGTSTITCDDGTKVTVGGDDTCSIADNGDGTSTITCDDGTTATVGKDDTCSIADNGDGTSTVTCDDGTTVTIGKDDTCSIADNGDGTSTITCDDGTSVVVGKDEVVSVKGSVNPGSYIALTHNLKDPVFKGQYLENGILFDISDYPKAHSPITMDSKKFMGGAYFQRDFGSFFIRPELSFIFMEFEIWMVGDGRDKGAEHYFILAETILPFYVNFDTQFLKIFTGLGITYTAPIKYEKLTVEDGFGAMVGFGGEVDFQEQFQLSFELRFEMQMALFRAIMEKIPLGGPSLSVLAGYRF